jgi:hypothetical protein
MKNLNQDNWFLARDMNPGFSKQEAGVLITQLQYSVVPLLRSFIFWDVMQCYLVVFHQCFTDSLWD